MWNLLARDFKFLLRRTQSKTFSNRNIFVVNVWVYGVWGQRLCDLTIYSICLLKFKTVNFSIEAALPFIWIWISWAAAKEKKAEDKNQSSQLKKMEENRDKKCSKNQTNRRRKWSSPCVKLSKIPRRDGGITSCRRKISRSAKESVYHVV
jgi:hypothetical protein